MPPPPSTAAAASHTTTTHATGVGIDPLLSHPPSVASASCGAAEEVEITEVAPLHLLDLRDPEVLVRLHALIGALPEAVCAFLDARAFPECMNHQLMRLSASGQVPVPTSVVNPKYVAIQTQHKRPPRDKNCGLGSSIPVFTHTHTHLLFPPWVRTPTSRAKGLATPP
jgi:hypothetical protein